MISLLMWALFATAAAVYFAWRWCMASAIVDECETQAVRHGFSVWREQDACCGRLPPNFNIDLRLPAEVERLRHAATELLTQLRLGRYRSDFGTPIETNMTFHTLADVLREKK